LIITVTPNRRDVDVDDDDDDDDDGPFEVLVDSLQQNAMEEEMFTSTTTNTKEREPLCSLM